MLFVRPEHLRLGTAAQGTTNRIDAPFAHADFEGSFVNVFCTNGDRKPLVSQTRSDPSLLGLVPDTMVPLGFEPADAVILPAGDLARE